LSRGPSHDRTQKLSHRLENQLENKLALARSARAHGFAMVAVLFPKFASFKKLIGFAKFGWLNRLKQFAAELQPELFGELRGLGKGSIPLLNLGRGQYCGLGPHTCVWRCAERAWMAGCRDTVVEG